MTAVDTAQTFSSPAYPNGYDHNLDCYWLIEADPGRSVRMEFTDINIEAHPSCSFDYVQLYDGELWKVSRNFSVCMRFVYVPQLK